MNPRPEVPDSPEKLPPGYVLRARLALMQNRLGRAGRLRSWATIILGFVALAVCAYLIGITS